jgi:hypothetical protein
MARPINLIATIALAIGAASGCGDVNASLQALADARQLSADLHVEFSKAADASNRAVMADTDAASVASAREAERAKQTVQKAADALRPILKSLDYADETRLLDEFVAEYAKYDAVDRVILELAVENTNLKAQRLAFGPGQDAADQFRIALEALRASAPAGDAWRIRALTETAIAAIRDIQVLQAPHIAEPDDAAMARLEKRMTSSEAAARDALKTLATVAPAASRPTLAAATAAMNQFMDIHRQILALSHRNTNVRSLALSLAQKPGLTAACEARLRGLQDALARHGPKVARWKS